MKTKKQNIQKVILIFGMLASFTAVILPQLAKATTWDIQNDYSTTNNPNGVYSYGWKPGITGNFKLYDSTIVGGEGGCAGVILSWYNSATTAIDKIPVIGKNITQDKTCYGIKPGEISLHPGRSGEFSTLRWTSPINGTINIKGYFAVGDVGIMSYFIRKNNSIDLYTKHYTYADGSFNINTEVSVGSTIDFLVGEGMISGSTPLHATITTMSGPTLHATALSPTMIRLSWNDNASGEKAFRIQRKAGDCSASNPWTTLVDVKANTTATFDENLTANTAYTYRIASYYSAQSFSPYSACVSATTAIAGTPMAPNNAIVTTTVAQSQSNSQVNLSWNDASANETRFDIYRKINDGEWAKLSSTVANSQSYRDMTATGNTGTTRYSYAVGACNAAGCSRLFQTPFVVPFSPTNLAANSGSSAINLTWNDKSGNESGFQLYRKNGGCASAKPWSVINFIIPANTQSYADGNVVSGETYSYQVRAYFQTAAQPFAFGHSGFSGCITATAP